MTEDTATPSHMRPRRQGREAALQALYLSDLTGVTFDELPEAAWMPGNLPPRAREFARTLARGAIAMRAELDALVQRFAQNWELPRMATIDRCILRLAAYEILKEMDTPLTVIINEAVDIAKAYSTADSGKFVNGILDQLKSERP